MTLNSIYKIIQIKIELYFKIFKFIYYEKEFIFRELFYFLQKKSYKFKVIFNLGDGDYYSSIGNKKYSPLIDSLYIEMKSIGIKCGILKAYDSLIPEKFLLQKTIPYKFQFFLYYIFGKLRNFSIEKCHLYSWNKILSRINPECIIGIQPNYYLCKTASKLKIPIYDLQHGIINPNNNYYKNFFNNKNNYLYKIISTFEYTSYNLKKQNLPIENIFYLGSPLLSDIYFDKNYKEEKKHKNKFVILFSHAAKYYAIFDHSKEKESWTDTALPINLLDSICELNFPLHLIIRLHPTCKFKYKVELDLKRWKMRTNNTFEITQGTTLNYDLYRSDLHITHQSAVLCEASEIGLRTLCLSEEINFEKFIIAQIDNNNVILLENQKDKIKEKIRYYYPIAKKKKISQELYRKAYLKRLHSFLRDEISSATQNNNC